MTTKTTKPKTVKQPKVPKLVLFTMKAVIATGPYENIQPEITIEAETLEHAHELVMPYIKGLYRDFSINKTPSVIPKVSTPDVAMMITDIPTPTEKTKLDELNLSEPAMTAVNAIKATTSKEVLAQLKAKVLASTKIPQSEKDQIIGIYFK
jgi:hypothetical protein